MSAAVTDAELDGLIASLEGVRFLAHHGWAIPVRHHRNIRQHGEDRPEVGDWTSAH